MVRYRWIVLLCGGVLFLEGCAAAPAERPALPAQEDAGSVHVAVLSVARWLDYSDALQPYFDLTADDALLRVLNINQVSSTDELERTRVQFAAGTRGAAPGTPAPGGPVGARVGADLDVTRPQRDAHTAYANAAALYQEVQLLNRYVRDAAIPKGYAPYVLRLQVTLLPRRRDEPFDAYSTLSFFSVGEGEIPVPTSYRGEKDAPRPAGGPRVLPLLVTDNLEASASSRSREQILEAALALGGGSGSVTGSVGFDSTNAKLDRVAGLDLNSLLTVARISENTLMVRLGAMQQGSTRFAMVPRTHNVTVVVMIPEGSPTGLQVLARTEFKDAETGDPLPQRAPERIHEILLEAGRPHGIQDVARLERLAVLAQTNQFAQFQETATGVEHPHELWVDLVGVLVGGQYSSVTVGLESRSEPAPEIPDLTQTIRMEDDGKTCSILLLGGRNLRPEHLEASLYVGEEGQQREIIARRVIVVGGLGVIIELPSLLAQDIKSVPDNSARLRLRDHGRGHDYRKTHYAQLNRGPAKPGEK